MGPVGRPEGIVDVQVGELREPARELRVVCLLARLDAAVLVRPAVARSE